MRNETAFAKSSIRAYQVYAYLAERERSPVLHSRLEALAHTSREQFDFWARKSHVRADSALVPKWLLFFYWVMRHICGIEYTSKFLSGRGTQATVQMYKNYCVTCRDEADTRAIEAFVSRLHTLGQGEN